MPNGGHGLTVEKAGELVTTIQASFVFLDDGPEVFRHWRRLVEAYEIVGKSVHDANVVASALAHGVTHLLTLNGRDFRRYAEISIVEP